MRQRLFVVTLVCAGLVFGVSILVGSGRAQAGSRVTYTCSALDKQFIQTVSSNMLQLGYWSDELVRGEATPGLVVKQARSEAAQVDATGPTDRTLGATRGLLRSMFLQYALAVRAKAHGRDPGVHMQSSYRLAGAVHDLLVGAKQGLAGAGCDVSPLLAG